MNGYGPVYRLAGREARLMGNAGCARV